MKPVSKHDYYECKRCYGASSMDLASLTDFYLPLIGTDAFGAYLALSREGEGVLVHENLFGLLGLTPGEYENALTALEAVGLVRTFVKSEGDVSLFVYCLYAPLHASEFNADIMLSGTLKGSLGVETYNRLLSRHQGESAVSDMEEVSASFPSYFQQTYDAKYYLGAGSSSMDGKAMVKTGFDRVTFNERLSSYGIRKNALSEEELTMVEKLATLYSLSEETMGELVFSSLRPNAPIGRKVDRETLTNLCAKAMPFTYLREEKGESSNVDSDTILAQKVKMMDSVPPARWLSILQNGHKPARSDLRLVERLMLEIGLPGPCVNALLEYVLSKNNNVLSAPYCEKIAAAMVREGCKSARDAMDYLKRGKRKKKETFVEAVAETIAKPEPPIQEKKSGDYVSDEEVDAALAGLFED